MIAVLPFSITPTPYCSPVREKYTTIAFSLAAAWSAAAVASTALDAVSVLLLFELAEQPAHTNTSAITVSRAINLFIWFILS